jgi:hypothetical protein
MGKYVGLADARLTPTTAKASSKTMIKGKVIFFIFSPSITH